MSQEELIKTRLIEESDEAFQYLCQLKMFQHYCKYGPYSEEIFERRSKHWFANNIIQLKPDDISWKEFYSRVMNIFRNIEEAGFLQRYLKNKNSFEAKLLNKINNL